MGKLCVDFIFLNSFFVYSAIFFYRKVILSLIFSISTSGFAFFLTITTFCRVSFVAGTTSVFCSYCDILF